MKYTLILLSLAIGIISCELQSKKNPVDIPIYSSEDLFLSAGKLAADEKSDSALKVLKLAFENGYENKMEIVSNRYFYPLIDDPETRPRARNLLREYGDQSEAVMVREEEIGERIQIIGSIRDENTDVPLSGVQIELIHTDNNGLYFDEKSTWNPRIFAYLISDEHGKFKVETIKPGSYEDDEGNREAEHIHFSLKLTDYLNFNSEFMFKDSPYLPEESGNLLLAEKNEEGIYVLTIRMQKAE